MVTLQIKSVTYPLWQDLWLSNLANWWRECTHEVTCLSVCCIKLRDKLKTKYFLLLKTHEHQTLQGAEVWWGKAPNEFVRLWSRDHKSRVTCLFFCKAYTTRLGRVVTYGDRKPPMESYDSLTTQSCEVAWNVISPLRQGLWLSSLAGNAYSIRWQIIWQINSKLTQNWKLLCWCIPF